MFLIERMLFQVKSVSGRLYYILNFYLRQKVGLDQQVAVSSLCRRNGESDKCESGDVLHGGAEIEKMSANSMGHMLLY